MTAYEYHQLMAPRWIYILVLRSNCFLENTYYRFTQ